jgi:hypothetical protein
MARLFYPFSPGWQRPPGQAVYAWIGRRDRQ